MASVRVKQNVWGNFGFFVGTGKVNDSGEKWLATDWLSEQLAAGHTLSPKSDITLAEVQVHRDRLAKKD